MSGLQVFREALWCLFAALSLSLASCGSSQEFYRDVERDISAGNYRGAIEGVRQNVRAYGDKNTILYNLDLGILYHYGGMGDSSTSHLLAAEREIDELYTKSISLAAASLILNDNILPYEGEDFEKVLINVFLALNFAEAGEPDEALVEARKVDLKLREYAKQYEGKNRYQDDAFVRYMAGALYESAGEMNDAFISYRMAFDAYAVYEKDYGTRAPSFLLDDLVRTATLLSFDEETAHYRQLGGRAYEGGTRPRGAILVVAYAGKGPVKQQVRPTVSVADDKGTIHTFQVALPAFVPRFTAGRSYSVHAFPNGDSVAVATATTEIAENVTAIAAKSLEDRLTMIYLKSGGRALLKFLAAEKAKQELKKKDDVLANVLGSVAVDAVVSATEQADLRTWRTLPAEFQLARLNVGSGPYTVRVVSSDGALGVLERKVTVEEGKVSLVIVDDVR